MYLLRRPRITQPQAGSTPVGSLLAPGGVYGIGYAIPFGATLSNSTGPLVAGSGVGGYAWTNDGVNLVGSIVTANSTVSKTSFSVLAVVEFASTGAKQSFLDRDINTLRSFQFNRSTGGAIEAVRFNTAVSSVVTATTTATVPVGIPTAVVLVVRGLDFAIYLGKDIARAAITGTPQTWDGVLGLCASWGGTSGTGGYPASQKLDGKLYAYAALPFALSESVAQALAQSPQAMRSGLYGYRRIPRLAMSATGVTGSVSLLHGLTRSNLTSGKLVA